MTLEFDTGQKIEEPCGNQIAEAVGGLPNRKDSFVVLSAARTNYIQVAADRSEKFTLEFQEGNRTRHFRAREKLGHDEVVDVLVRYSRGDLKWKTTLVP